MLRSSVLLALILLPVLSSNAQTPDNLGPTLSFQGYLATDSGDPLDSTEVGITFKLYKEGSEIWTEDRLVDVVGGIFDVALGQYTTLDTILFNRPIELGIKLDGEPSEMSPRTPLRSAAYALSMRGMHSYWAEDVNSNEGFNLLGGAWNNVIGPEVVGATIGGGGGVQGGTDAPHTIMGDFGTIAGGARNSVGLYAGTVGGGVTNDASGRRSTIAGGDQNISGGQLSSVGGGYRNLALGDASVVGGGDSNVANSYGATIAGGVVDSAMAEQSTVCGGILNAAKGYAASVGGGASNKAVGDSSTVAGGASNQALGRSSTVAGGNGHSADGDWSTVGGGFENTAWDDFATVSGGGGNTATGRYATVAGGAYNLAAGWYTFAAGHSAEALHSGSFVWADDGFEAFSSTGGNQFLIRASGGVGIGRNNPRGALDVQGEAHFEGTVRPGTNNAYSMGSSGRRWSTVYTYNPVDVFSDQRLKDDIQPLGYGLDDLMKLHPVSFVWKDGPDNKREIGLIAQETVRVIPEVVSEPDGEDGYFGISYAELVPLLIKAIQDQQVEIERLKAAVTERPSTH